MTDPAAPGPRVAGALPANVGEALSLLSRGGYVADGSLATAVFLSLSLGRPLFLEGEAGVGKTEIANVLAAVLGRRLIRLQCYEGLDLSSAVYEWNYPRQMIEIRLAEAEGGRSREALADGIFSTRFLIKRPLLQAWNRIRRERRCCSSTRSTAPTSRSKRFLLEVLSDFRITIPEIGPIEAAAPPIVVITSNRTREVHDALKRRCFYYWVDYPDAARELEILRIKAPEAGEALRRQVVAFVRRLREQDLFKAPGVAETIDWSQALVQLDAMTIEHDVVNDTLGALLKYQDDIERVRGTKPPGSSKRSPRILNGGGGVVGPYLTPTHDASIRSVPRAGHPLRARVVSLSGSRREHTQMAAPATRAPATDRRRGRWHVVAANGQATDDLPVRSPEQGLPGRRGRRSMRTAGQAR